MWFSIPLDANRSGIGLIARRGRSGTALGYLFDRVFTSTPSLEDVAALTAQDAVIVYRFFDNRVADGSWPIIGTLPDWDPGMWPMPLFANRHSNLEVHYSDDEPARAIKRTRRTAEELSPLSSGAIFASDSPADDLQRLLNIQPPALRESTHIPKEPPIATEVPEPVYDLVVTLAYDEELDGVSEIEAARDQLEDAISTTLGETAAGSVDGNLIGEGELIIYIDGPDPDAILAAIRPSLTEYPPLRPRDAVLKRSGHGETITF